MLQHYSDEIQVTIDTSELDVGSKHVLILETYDEASGDKLTLKTDFLTIHVSLPDSSELENSDEIDVSEVELL